MNYFKIFGIIVSSLLLLSCSDEDNLTSETKTTPRLQSYHFRNMHYPIGMATSPILDNLVKISYNSYNKITKRVGGILYYNPNSGMSTGFTDLIYDELVYFENQIQINRKTSSTNFDIYDFERKFTLDNRNRIVKKITYKENAVYPDLVNDTINYYYNKLNQISETISGESNSYNIKSKYYYNQNGNLDSIVSKRYYQEELITKTIEIFSNYDTSINPMKKLIIFEETFNRSLSKNNYSKYDKFTYDSSNTLISYENRNWNLNYDTLGNINYNLF